MVERYENKAVVVDLDGTLIRGNSMVMFCRWAVGRMIARARFGAAMSVMMWIAARKCRLTSHARMKQAILKRCEGKFSDNEIEEFIAGKLDGIVNEKVLRISRESGYVQILATAAPALYSKPFGRRLGFDHTLATEYSATAFIENCGINKLESVYRLLSDIGAELDIVITDHPDDTPLLRANRGLNYIVDGDNVTIQKSGTSTE